MRSTICTTGASALSVASPVTGRAVTRLSRTARCAAWPTWPSTVKWRFRAASSARRLTRRGTASLPIAAWTSALRFASPGSAVA